MLRTLELKIVNGNTTQSITFLSEKHYDQKSERKKIHYSVFPFIFQFGTSILFTGYLKLLHT